MACYQLMPDAQVVLVGEESRVPAQNLIRLPAWKLPYLGAPERWTAALSWFRHIDRLDPGPIDCVMSLELYNPTSLQANRLARRLGVPHVVTIAELLSPCPLYSIPPWQQLSRHVSRAADAFVCNVEMARQSAIARGCPPERCVVVNPGIDLERFSPRPGGLTPDPVVMYVGELRPDKGVRDVIAAAHLARQRVPDLRLVIAGGGPLREEVQGHARRVDFVEYLGKVPRDELPDLYRAARCFTLAPQTRRFWAEQFGFASVEAMASGLPVVITDCGAVSEVVPDWNPVCAEGDVTALADGLVSALGSEGETWGGLNRDHAEKHYESAAQAATLREWLNTVVRR
jgi:glycosyltransferase involved in cell wall biosynthesis